MNQPLGQQAGQPPPPRQQPGPVVGRWHVPGGLVGHPWRQPQLGVPAVVPPWAGPGGVASPASPAAPGRRRSPLPWLLGGFSAGVVLLGVVLWLGFVSPAWFVRAEFDADAVQKGVEQVLTTSYRVPGVEAVACPAGQPVRASHGFTCAVTVAGQHRTVLVTVRDDRGTYQVGQPG